MSLSISRQRQSKCSVFSLWLSTQVLCLVSKRNVVWNTAQLSPSVYSSLSGLSFKTQSSTHWQQELYTQPASLMIACKELCISCLSIFYLWEFIITCCVYYSYLTQLFLLDQLVFYFYMFKLFCFCALSYTEWLVLFVFSFITCHLNFFVITYYVAFLTSYLL